MTNDQRPPKKRGPDVGAGAELSSHHDGDLARAERVSGPPVRRPGLLYSDAPGLMTPQHRPVDGPGCTPAFVPGTDEQSAAEPGDGTVPTRARVRVTKEYKAGAPVGRPLHFKVDQKYVMVRWSKPEGSGRLVDESVWWTSYDIDGAFAIPSDHVEIVEVLEYGTLRSDS